MSRNGRVIEAISTLSSAIQANPAMAEGTVQVRARWVDGTRVIGKVREFDPITIDEPPALGGEDQGPTPVELLLLALGSCQEIVYAAYAEQLGIQLDAIEIELTGTLDLRGFLGIDPSVRPGFRRIEARVRLVSPEPESRLRELADLVERFCPVQDMLTNPVPIRISLAIERPTQTSAA
uniref:OsmC family peroxiredoxin n=2 Tax=Thermorudis TaxID=1649508 RepID=A0A831X867_9BACT